MELAPRIEQLGSRVFEASNLVGWYVEIPVVVECMANDDCDHCHDARHCQPPDVPDHAETEDHAYRSEDNTCPGVARHVNGSESLNGPAIAARLHIPPGIAIVNPGRESEIVDAVFQSEKPIRGEPVESCKLHYFNSFEFLTIRRQQS